MHFHLLACFVLILNAASTLIPNGAHSLHQRQSICRTWFGCLPYFNNGGSHRRVGAERTLNIDVHNSGTQGHASEQGVIDAVSELSLHDQHRITFRPAANNGMRNTRIYVDIMDGDRILGQHDQYLANHGDSVSVTISHEDWMAMMASHRSETVTLKIRWVASLD